MQMIKQMPKYEQYNIINILPKHGLHIPSSIFHQIIKTIKFYDWLSYVTFSVTMGQSTEF